MGVVVFNGVPSTSFGIEVSTPPDYSVAQRKYSDIEIPGRNGSLHIDEKAFKNVERRYDVSFLANRKQDRSSFQAASAAIAEWLSSSSGYLMLEDSYEPEFYRLARFVDALDISNIYGEAGTFELVFDCRPERFLKSGLNQLTVTTGTTLHNPTKFPAKPTFQVVGSGATHLYCGSRGVHINMGTTYTTATIDCDKQEVYTGSTNLGSITTLSGGGFPELQNGVSTITFSNLSSVKIIPNWWTL